ncbi:restriction endonuclease subunit S [Arcobacter cloacae]|uniref:Restriction endonuclease subunit S n=1 Tax=Arcobacter cloacae TaxID=1054034 RepID=A0A4Q0ZQN2_9BACT|nr:restriction endonuclease subunit S [Arcobacter cloacae]RXJ85898.1 restriction endonuclease subunit S [Arcobacter cloacae]
MSSWKECKLGDIAKLSKKTWKVGDELMPYIGLEHIEESKLRLNAIGSSENVASNKFRFQAGDTLFGKLRPYFRKVIKPNFDGVCSTDIWVLNPQKGIDKDFLFYFFANQELVDISYSASSGTRMPRADWDFLSQTLWNIPPLEEQKAIAEVLSSLDDKIDLLHRQNQTLESLAQTLFRQWFIEEAKDEWDVAKLPDEFDFTMGLSPSGSTYNEEKNGMPMFQGNADFEFRFPSNRVYTTDPKRIAKRFDTLVSVRAPVGAQNMAKEKCCIGRGVASFRYKFDNSFYTYTYYKMHSLMEEIKQFNETGTVFGSIGKSDFEAIEIIKPPFEYVAKFQNEVKSIDDKIILNCEQIKSLENLRDTLLPKLLSEEVRINL